jgi:hypothetical protein
MITIVAKDPPSDKLSPPRTRAFYTKAKSQGGGSLPLEREQSEACITLLTD